MHPWQRLRFRHFVPGAAVEKAAGFLFVFAAPLLEEECDARSEALIADVGDPLRVHRASLRAGLATDDHPVDVSKIEFHERAKQRLDRKELHARICTSKLIDARDVVGIFHTHAHPHIRRPVEFAIERCESIGALGEHLKAVPVRAAHDVEDALDVLDRHIFVEEIAHRVDEDRLRLFPLQRKVEHLRLKRERKAVPIVRLPHRLQPLRHALRIAVLAPRADFRATRDRVPSGLRPFDARSLGHQRISFKIWFAILSAIGAPFGFAAAKQSK